MFVFQWTDAVAALVSSGHNGFIKGANATVTSQRAPIYALKSIPSSSAGLKNQRATPITSTALEYY